MQLLEATKDRNISNTVAYENTLIVAKRLTRYMCMCLKSILPTVQFNEKRWKASDESACYKQNKLQVTKEYNKRK